MSFLLLCVRCVAIAALLSDLSDTILCHTSDSVLSYPSDIILYNTSDGDSSHRLYALVLPRLLVLRLLRLLRLLLLLLMQLLLLLLMLAARRHTAAGSKVMISQDGGAAEGRQTGEGMQGDAGGSSSGNRSAGVGGAAEREGEAEAEADSPVLRIEAWQYDLIFGSESLKRRVRDSLLRLLLVENLASPASSTVTGAAGGVGEAGEGVGTGEVSAAGPEGEGEGEAGEEEGGRATRASKTWQRALDQVLLDLEELVALSDAPQVRWCCERSCLCCVRL